MNYKLEVILGTEEIVLSELLEKFPAVFNTKTEKGFINFSSDLTDIDEFRTLYSPLRIEKENGLIRNLFRREWKIEAAPAGINPSLAYILCKFAEVNSNDIVLDPFCGAGTIGITAAKYFNPKKVLMSDKSGRAIDMTEINLKASGLKKGKVVLFRANINMLRLNKGSITKIITNPPFGIRTGSHEENLKVYTDFEKKINSCLVPNGEIVVVTQEKELLEDIFSKRKYKLMKKITVSQGGLFPTIYKFILIP